MNDHCDFTRCYNLHESLAQADDADKTAVWQI